MAILQFPATKPSCHNCWDCKCYMACAHVLEIFQVCVHMFTPPVHSGLRMSKTEHLGEIWQEKQWPHCQKEVVHLLSVPVNGNVVPPQMPCQLTCQLQPKSSVVLLHQFWALTKQVSLEVCRILFLWPQEELCDTHRCSERIWLTLLADFTEIWGSWPCCHKYSLLSDGLHVWVSSELFHLKNSQLSKEGGKRSKEKRKCSIVIKDKWSTGLGSETVN